MKILENKVYKTSIFDSDYKRFAKKFASLKSEIQQLEKNLIKQPDIGISLGGGVYKIVEKNHRKNFITISQNIEAVSKVLLNANDTNNTNLRKIYIIDN